MAAARHATLKPPPSPPSTSPSPPRPSSPLPSGRDIVITSFSLNSSAPPTADTVTAVETLRAGEAFEAPEDISTHDEDALNLLQAEGTICGQADSSLMTECSLLGAMNEDGEFEVLGHEGEGQHPCATPSPPRPPPINDPSAKISLVLRARDRILDAAATFCRNFGKDYETLQHRERFNLLGLVRAAPLHAAWAPAHTRVHVHTSTRPHQHTSTPAHELVAIAVMCINVVEQRDLKGSAGASVPKVKLAWAKMPTHSELSLELLPAVYAWMMDEKLCPTSNPDICAVREEEES